MQAHFARSHPRGLTNYRSACLKFSAAHLSGMICGAGMSLGLIVDLERSATGTIPGLCSGGNDLAQRIFEHATMMPFAHAGMLLGVALCVVAQVSSHSLDVSATFARIALRVAQMAAVEAGSLLLSGDAKPMFVMAIMGGLMILPDLLVATGWQMLCGQDGRDLNSPAAASGR